MCVSGDRCAVKIGKVNAPPLPGKIGKAHP
jgi:hypothetical protein